MSSSIAWPAPAKLNLFLHITGRRADGYHLLQTVFQFLDRGDSLEFDVREDGRIVRSEGPSDIPEGSDIVIKAARLLKERSGTRLGASIKLRKILPVEAGLGGGSSDAATTLVALDRLWGTAFRPGDLAALGLELGADVPVFIGGHAAWAEGVGEILDPLELPEPWYLVLQPACRVSTREIFQAPELTRNSAPITIARFRSGETRNDFEPVVRSRYPQVSEALDWLGSHASAHLTGSGACVFAAFPDEAAARRVYAQLPQGWRGFVAKGCNRSPLLARLEAEKTWGVAKR
ncbi:MAG TPA: 4-(cytidine 5'-diphospho)-2-C-methyl-D-erythritol kinase [Gammaproteobacteria bacterium]|nr:4-(cytidine 5'-diphospho)-2-C-methyl-D-erythritol kinase [Gammaproteobacteria bacterium]